MTNQQTIVCAFCQGTGDNPHFRGTCPVCKGRGKNDVTGKYMICSSCRGSGRKIGTTLTCYDCGGLGIVPDTRETFRKAREEIGEARKDLVRERDTNRYPSGYLKEELTEKPMVKITKTGKHKLLKRKDKEDEWEKEKTIEESSGKIHFCQCCADEVNESIQIKICHDCFGKMKEIA